MAIKLTKGNIAVETVDVIVNTTGSNLNMACGNVSSAISLAAGPLLQQECNALKSARGSVASWSFLETRPGRLTCKKIYHCVCEGYNQFQSERFEQLLKKLVSELMVHASNNGMNSMAIPALGTGVLGYPPAVTARCMYQAALEFSSQHPNGSLKDVRFVLYDRDMNTIRGFEKELQSLYHSSHGATTAATVEQPANWTTMEYGELTKMVTLTAGTAEHSSVENHFRSSNMSAFNRIVEIQRVQNQRLYIQYQIHKAALEIRLSRSNVEKVLFHGTDEQNCNAISRNGFNRSFMGRNAAYYGNGTYFAVQAGYSARTVFARPIAFGIMHILMTKVLVGDFIRGYRGMITPLNNPLSPGELYDSAVDNVNDPSIYVIFNDTQAYPEYIIKFM